MAITREQARTLAKSFRDGSTALGDYRFEHWATLTPAQRQKLEDTEWTLLNNSSDFITTAVGLVLDDVEADFKTITGATEKARRVLKTISDVKNVLSIGAAMVALGGAIVAGIAAQNPAPVMAATADLVKTLKAVRDSENG